MKRESDVKMDQVRNGRWKEFNKRGVLIAEGMYVNGQKHGLWLEYYDHDGRRMIEENYDYGIPHGRYACFHPNGQILSEGQFENGLRAGRFNIYDEQGNKIRTLFFIDGMQVEDNNQVKHAEDKVDEGTTGS
ncbi:MAG TPA: hypothetical protein VEB86_08595 [Chryseosolibacter sp.]|nr:hypothetical protein [Chryseosolibacter sp.]